MIACWRHAMMRHVINIILLIIISITINNYYNFKQSSDENKENHQQGNILRTKI